MLLPLKQVALAATLLMSMFTALIAAPCLAADQYAVVVGVSKYAYLDPQFNLVGPRNDALLVREFLLQRGFAPERIRLLTEDVSDARLPTRSNIFDAIESVKKSAKQGDFLYLHFSGHGSQQPSGESVEEATEIDGLDETFLPADTKNWNNTIQSVENIISDDAISQVLSDFAAQGVFVWLVFDSCHSGTMSRNQWRSREIKPNLLGIPTVKSRGTEPSAVSSNFSEAPITLKRPSENRLPENQLSENQLSEKQLAEKQTGLGGGYVAFFAAQTNEETPEMKLPRKSEDSKAYGLFTYQLIRAMSQHPGATYRQIAAQVVQNYAAEPWYGSRPMFVGNGLDQVALTATSEQHAIRQWAINLTDTGYELPVGYLQGLTVGSSLLVLASPADEDANAIGMATVVKSDAITSQIKVTAQPDQPKLDSASVLPANAYARLVETKFDSSLRVALMDTDDGRLANQLEKIDMDPVKLEWVSAEDDADIRILKSRNHEGKAELILLTDGEPLPCLAVGSSESDVDQSDRPACAQPNRSYVKVLIDDNLPNTMKDTLRVIAKAMNLMRLGTMMEGEALNAELVVKRQSTDEIERFDGLEVPKLYSGDEVSLTLANYLEEPLDITVLFVGSDYSIDVLFPRKNSSNRFMEEEELTLRLGRINARTTGVERLIIIGNQAIKGSIPADYRYLAQKGLVKRRGDDVQTSELDRVLMNAGFGNRGSVAGEMQVSESVRVRSDIQTISWVTAVDSAAP